MQVVCVTIILMGLAIIISGINHLLLTRRVKRLEDDMKAEATKVAE